MRAAARLGTVRAIEIAELEREVEEHRTATERLPARGGRGREALRELRARLDQLPRRERLGDSPPRATEGGGARRGHGWDGASDQRVAGSKGVRERERREEAKRRLRESPAESSRALRHGREELRAELPAAGLRVLGYRAGGRPRASGLGACNCACRWPRATAARPTSCPRVNGSSSTSRYGWRSLSRSPSPAYSATLYIDTPEGSLDIAYERRAGRMFGKFVEGHERLFMTANINTSQLLQELAPTCGTRAHATRADDRLDASSPRSSRNPRATRGRLRRHRGTLAGGAGHERSRRLRRLW